jgi:hypothetical protein
MAKGEGTMFVTGVTRLVGCILPIVGEDQQFAIPTLQGIQMVRHDGRHR